MMKSLGRLLLIFSVLMLLLAGCSGDTPEQNKTTTQMPDEEGEISQPAQQEESLESILEGDEVLYPLVLSSEPGLGELLSPDGSIMVVFDQPMDAVSVEDSWKLFSSDGVDVSGKFTWQTDDTSVSFTPTKKFENGLQYELTIGEAAESRSGAALEDGFAQTFYTEMPVQISQVFPEPGSNEVDTYTQITAIFNQPVVSLKIIEEQNTLVQPLQFDPPVSGSGEWINTSVYVFQPDAPLKGASGYTVNVKEDLSPETAEQTVSMDGAYQWSFFTQVPEISYVQIGSDWVYPPKNKIDTPISILPAMEIHFHQPMNKNGAWNYVTLIGPNQELVPLRYTWDVEGYILKMKPREFLRLGGESYQLRIDSDFPAANGGTLQEGMSIMFNTIEAPSIRSIYKNEYESVIVDFRTDMNPDTFERRIIVDPPLENMSYYYQSWNDNLLISGFMPSQKYTVTILAGTTDIFGNAINYDVSNTFTFDDLDPYLYLDLPGEPQYRVDGPQDAFYEYINVETVDIELYRIERSQFVQYMSGYKPALPGGDPILEQHLDVETPLNTKVVKRIDFTNGGEDPLPQGYYLLCVDSPEVENDSSRSYLYMSPFMVVSDSLMLKNSNGNGLVWQTNLTSGEPVANNPVEVRSLEHGVIASGKTNSDGVFLFDFEELEPYDDLYAYSTDFDHLAMTSQYYYSGVSAYDFGIWAEYYSNESFDALRTYIYTDKPLYRPGQTVYFKGVVRNDRDLVYTLPGDKLDEVEIVVRNYEKEIYTTRLSLNEFGSFDGEFELSEGTTLGSYFISALDPATDESIGSVDFSVAEYRKPEFLVDVSVEPNQVTLGDIFSATIESAYYSGGGLVDAPIYYALRSSPYSFYPGGDFSNYNFTDVVNVYYGGASTEEYYRQISEGHAFTDEEGKYQVDIPADSRSATESQLIDLDVSVFDVAGNEVAAHSSVVAHSSKVYAGVDSASYVGKVGEEQFFNLAAVNWDGEAVAEQVITAKVYKLEWYSVRKEDASGVLHWEFSKRETPVTNTLTAVTDEDGLASISFVPEVGGTYFARVNTLDDRGRQSQSSAMMWVSSRDYIPWKQSDDRTFELVTDKDSYEPGEDAEILIASPYQGEAYALITVERGLIRSQEVIYLEDNSTIYKVPITKDMAPTVYISVMVVKGVDEFNPYPDFKMSMAALDVSTEKQELTVNLEVDKEQAGPGDEVTYDVEVLDAEGDPAEAEVSLGLTDLSVLVLADSNAPSMLNYFYNQRALSVQTSASITRNVEAYNAELSETVTEGLTAGSGGGKGGGEYGVESVRQDFPDTPFWLPDAVTDVEGKATVTVTLPDNLTTWRMDTRAITKDTEVGSNLIDIISTKPLLVRPQTPRFFVIGDELTIGTAVHNNSDEDLGVAVSIEASGVEVMNEVEQTVDIPARQQVFVTWQVSVPLDSERADFIFRASSEEYSDASLPTLGTLDNQGIPVYRYEVPETVSTSGSLSDGGMRTETIQMPQTMEVQNGQLDITIEPSLLVGMQAGLDYLESYPYECNEQTVSRFLPNILTYQAMKEAGMEDAELEANLEKEVNLAIQRLDSAQRSDGGWGWWPSSSQSNEMVSAYVLFGMWKAKEAGYDVDDEMIANGQDYLLLSIENYRIAEDVYKSYKVNRMAFMVYVMNMMDQPVVSYAVELADNWKYLSLESQAYLALTLHNINENDARIATLKNAIMDEVLLSASGAHWEESANDYYNWGTDTRSTAVILDTMISLEPENPITANAVRWLMRNRKNGHWASTQETAWTLLSLTNWMKVSGDLEADYAYAIKLNGEELDSGAIDQTSLEEIRTLQVDVSEFMQEELNRLTVARTAGDGNLYYTADLDVYLPVDEVEALDQGVIVSRSYYQQDDLETEVTQANQGDILVAQITIVLPHASHYLLVEDMLPAGMEAVDTSLNTSRSYYGGLGLSSERYWWRWYFDHTELRDEKVALTAEYLPAGTYTYTYLVRASFPGTFNVIPTVAQEFYFPDVYGRGDGSQFVILPN